MPYTLKPILTCIFTVLFYLGSMGLNAKTLLNESEKKGFARACLSTVKDAFGDYFVYANGYSYFEPEIEQIHSGGANISAVIKLSRITKSGGNNGWGEEKSKETFQYFECIFNSVPKGKFPQPDFFIRYAEKNSANPWIIVEDMGYGHIWGKCDTKLFCREPSEEWVPIDMAPKEPEYSDYGDRYSRNYDIAKSRAPKQWIWEKPFE